MRRYILAGMTVFGVVGLATTVVWTAHGQRALAHCQVPCGIYDDAARIGQLQEDATTIGKAIASINDLAGKHDALSINQATRWVTTKEAHASHVIEVVAEYFLTQKVKPVAAGAEGRDAYLGALADHHAVMVAAMKCKQSADPGVVADLEKAIQTLAAHY